MDREYYINHIVLDGHLNNPIYKPIPNNADQKVFQDLSKLVNKHSSNLTKKEKEYVLDNTWKTSEFYCTIKTHKCKSIQEAILQNDNDSIINVLKPNDLKGRPIVAGPSSPTQALSSLIEKILKPIVPCLTTYIKDDWHFIKQLPQTLDYKATLYSCDIESLYTSIPIDLGLEAVSYWLNNKSNLIPHRFTKEFILEALEFVLRNNNFKFNENCYNQTEGTAMGTKCAPPYACLVVGYKEETKLFPIELPKYFSNEEIKGIKEVFKRYMDDGFLLWPENLNFNNFMICLNNLHPSIKYTFEKDKIMRDENGNTVQILNFLNINVILNDKNELSTDVYYKDTNTHDYLPYDSAHPESCKKNVPYNLAKRIIIFVTDPEKVEVRLTELRTWLKNNKYPDHIISNAFHNARLQDPAPKPKDKLNNIPFVTTFHEDIDNNIIMKNIKRKIENNLSDYIKEIFQESNIFLSQRQPKNLLRLLSSSSISNTPSLPKGTFKCNDKRCKICKLYLIECSEIQLANNKIWKIETNITCNSRNVIYYLKCKFCLYETYIGKTIGDPVHGFKGRMNNHISEIKKGISTCKFPIHVFNCSKRYNRQVEEPYFTIHVMLSLKK